MDHERRHGVASCFELRHGADGVDFGPRGRGGQRGGRETVEHHAEAVAFFEEGEDELGARVARPDPAEIGAVGAGGGVVGCDLRAERIGVSEGRVSLVIGRFSRKRKSKTKIEDSRVLLIEICGCCPKTYFAQGTAPRAGGRFLRWWSATV